MGKTPRIQYVSELIRNLIPKGNAHQRGLSPHARIFSQFDEGTLFLDRTESRAYAKTLNRLVEQFGKAEDISPTAIERALQRAIFSAIDIPKTRQGQPLEERIKAATTALLNSLSQPAKTYQCYVPVGGIEPKGLPYRFGRVTFLTFNKHHLRKFDETVRVQQVSADQKKLRKDLLKKLQQSSIWNSPCARTEVRAQDSDAALVLARQQVRGTIDSLNFFSDLIPYNAGWLHFPEEAAQVSLVSPMLREDCSFFLPYQTKGPLMSFSFERLRKASHLGSFLRKVDRLLRRDPQRDIDQLLVSAVQWAGRASIEMRREEAFVLSAVALESIILPESDPRELSYRLRIRTAHLLGSTMKERSEISTEVSNLYTIRSRIVHNGHYQITDAERNRIKAIVTQVILAILSSRAVAKLGSRKEFGQWFESKVLS